MLLKASLNGALAFFCLFRFGFAQTPPPIPAQFQAAYNTVNADISNFRVTVEAAWDGSPYPVLYSAQLLSANSALASGLLAPNYYQVTVLSELTSLQSLGVRAITFHVNFPSLFKPFYLGSADYQAYVNFYTQLVNEIHFRGLKVILENTTVAAFPGLNVEAFQAYYKGLNWSTYQSQRALLAADLVKILHPDYLVLVAEPDSEASDTGQVNAGTVAGSTHMVEGMLAAIQETGVTGVVIGAGCGTWNSSFLPFIESFGTLPLQFIDMHVYPVNKHNLPDAMAALKIIQAAGKQPTMSEMWAYKETDAEIGTLSYTTIFARDVFSFWESTDISFLQTLSEFATYGHFAFMSPFWSRNFAAYLNYNRFSGQPDSWLLLAEAKTAAQAESMGEFSATGLAYEKMILP